MSQQNNTHRSPGLEVAWQRFADFDASAIIASNRHLTLRWWVIVLAVVATLLAILANLDQFVGTQWELPLKVGLILVPAISSGLVYFASKMQQGERWLMLRTGAEEIKKEIYLYRTILQQQPARDQWLNDRVTAIQRQVFEAIGGDLVLTPYKGSLPPYYSPARKGGDTGFNDLLVNEYLEYRLNEQLDYHQRKLERFQSTRTRLQIAVVSFGVIGTVLGALGTPFSIWVALTTSLVAAFTAWLELRRIDSTITNYSQIIQELKILRDHWLSLPVQQQTGDEFFKLVDAAEKVLWSQHNKYISEMRQAVAEAQGQDGDILAKVMRSPAPAAIDAALLEEAKKAGMSLLKTLPQVRSVGDVVDAVGNAVQEVGAGVITAITEDQNGKEEGVEEGTQEETPAGTPADVPAAPKAPSLAAAVEKPGTQQTRLKSIKLSLPAAGSAVTQPAASSTITKPAAGSAPPQPNGKKGLPHAFVVMPFGRKQGPDGRWIDFNAIYEELIKPALILAGFEPFRADEESVSGDILTDMFQELLLADLVIADLSIDNANVFYELGARHALRSRGLVHIQSGRAYMPFDIFNVRTIPYHTDKNGRPDPEFLEKDKQTIAKIAGETWASSQERIHSPIFNLLNGLAEPDRKALRTPLAKGYWREYQDWQQRVEIAQRQKRIGDVLLLSEEISNPLIKEDVITEAGKALRNFGRHELALRQYREGLKLNPKNSLFRREEAFHLGRLQRYDEAIVKLEKLLADEPTNIEAISYLGRIYKEMWINEWTDLQSDAERQQKAYNTSYWLKKAIDTYLSGYRLDQNHFYSGVNAVMLSLLLDSLAQRYDPDEDPEIQTMRQELPMLKGAVQFSLESQAQKNTGDFWLYVSLADLAVCVSEDPKAIRRAYQKALTLAGQNRFSLGASLAQLNLLKSLGFRPEHVEAGITVLKEEINKMERELQAAEKQTEKNPVSVFLFSGHMIDQPGRREPRFPAGMEKEASHRIERVLDRLKADANDMAITAGAACGGDILFIEACLKRNMRVEVLLPFSEAKFIEESVSFAGDDWVERFYTIRNHPNVSFQFQLDRVGPLPEGANAYERNNLWALYCALIYGIDKVRLMVLWNGKGGDGPGGTGHMVQEVRRLGGIVEHLDTTKFNYWQAQAKAGKVLDQPAQEQK